MATKKDAAVSFLRMAASGHARDAFAKYVGEGFHHHNPFFEDRAETLMTAMDENARQNPEKRLDVLRALEDGDLVAVHSHVRQKPDDRGAAVVHIFRFNGNRIVELWDLGQAVPPDAVNSSGMF